MRGFHAGWRKSGIGDADGKFRLMEYLQTHVSIRHDRTRGFDLIVFRGGDYCPSSPGRIF